jgi:hypothetical protein
MLRDSLDEETKRELAEKLIALALGGDLRSIQEVFDRTDGKPLQRQEIAVEDARIEVVDTDGEPVEESGNGQPDPEREEVISRLERGRRGGSA